MRQSHTDIGKKLKQIRIDRDIDLKDIEKQTNINIKILNFIEEGEFYRLPKGIFAKSFVRQYCIVLDLNPEEFLDIIFEADQEDSPDTLLSEQNTQKEKNSVAVKVIVALFLIIFLCFIGFKIFIPSKPNLSEKEDIIKEPITESQALVIKEEEFQEGKLESSNLPEDPAIPQVTEQTDTVDIVSDESGQMDKEDKKNNIKSYALKFSAENDCWIKWESSTEKRDLILKKGETVVYSIAGELTLTLGNAPALKVFIDESELVFPKDRKVLKDYKIDLKKYSDQND